MTGLHHDAAEEAWYWPDIASQIDGDGDLESARVMIADEVEKRARRQAATIANHVVCTILGYENTKLALIAYAIAHGIGGLGEHSIREWADKLGVKKQAISKEVTWFRDVYKLEAMGALKTDLARNRYRTAQNRRYKNHQNGNGKHFNFAG